jgi:hypothetical protein
MVRAMICCAPRMNGLEAKKLFSQILAQSGLMSATRSVLRNLPGAEPMGHSNNRRVSKTLNALLNCALKRKHRSKYCNVANKRLSPPTDGIQYDLIPG